MFSKQLSHAAQFSKVDLAGYDFRGAGSKPTATGRDRQSLARHAAKLARKLAELLTEQAAA